MPNPWFRLYSKIITDPIIEFLSFEDQRHFVWLLCLKNDGVLDKKYPEEWMLDRVVAKKLGLQGEAFETMKERLVNSGLIDGHFRVKKWDDLQFKSDSSRERVRKYREKTDTSEEGSNMKRYSNVTVTAQETDTEHKNHLGHFDQFWDIYPKKVKKKTSIDIWKRKKLDSKVEIIVSDITVRKKEDRRWKDGFIPDPTTYLNQERWDDEIERVGQSDDLHKAI